MKKKEAITDYKLNDLNSFFARFETHDNIRPQKTPPPPRDQALCLSAARVKVTLCTLATPARQQVQTTSLVMC